MLEQGLACGIDADGETETDSSKATDVESLGLIPGFCYFLFITRLRTLCISTVVFFPLLIKLQNSEHPFLLQERVKALQEKSVGISKTGQFGC